ncbi:thiamine-phosphate synthase family protein [Methanolacinia paynteri]|uniref:thiamine-phosphate synthase family protein n=1 Tax=Methanolacinia paynteri TaxID=230356 RepID=UPI00064E34D4|nr:thiamine-phosphate synthase family protein [Methanolacinia paynteri]
MGPDGKEKVIGAVQKAVGKISEYMNSKLIPEVGMNIGFAIPDATSVSDVAAVEGRIVRKGDAVFPVGDVKMGASDHVARIIITAMKYDPEMRAAANVRYSDAILKVLEDMPLEIRSFDRGREPAGVSTMDWGVASCCSEDDVPDVIYDMGAVGKEPMIRILGEDPASVVNNILMLSERINDKIL